MRIKKKQLMKQAEQACDALDEAGFISSIVEDSNVLMVECELNFGDLIRTYDFMSGKITNTDAMGNQLLSIPEKYADDVQKMDRLVQKSVKASVLTFFAVNQPICKDTNKF